MRAVGPGHFRLEGGEEVVNGVGDDDAVVGGHEEGDDHTGQTGT